MPSSAERTKSVIDGLYERRMASDGPDTASPDQVAEQVQVAASKRPD
nr:hypothetical protein [Kibdelosporangium sp. MJ126-NF4]CEL22028.1 hypothetical protein [Kibdelosporangium sp. MJ126-NF4]CTQ92808.1 hypothetical protein [Kibdelosporangium sp. MJ126-NF4]